MPNTGYDQYIHSAAWRSKASKRLELDKHICQVCGRKATEVHHLTYDRFRQEDMSDLVSLCRGCHEKAEELYDPSIVPWAMDEVKPDGNNFMAAMREDALRIAPLVLEYVKGDGSFGALMRLRQPIDADGKKYWEVLKRGINALCRKRYSMNCVADRMDMMLTALENHVIVVCLQSIEHYVRNGVQALLHDQVMETHKDGFTWREVAEQLGITQGTLNKLRKDDGESLGPSLREAVLYYCGLDAVAGIRPLEGFSCLNAEDYKTLNEVADYMVTVSGSGRYRGEQ